eukprot:11206472-Lingulodinium_polyedra.AAC.1
MIAIELEKYLHPLPPKCAWLVSWAACERDKLCQQVILNGKDAPEHVFDDIVDRIPVEPRVLVQQHM